MGLRLVSGAGRDGGPTTRLRFSRSMRPHLALAALVVAMLAASWSVAAEVATADAATARTLVFVHGAWAGGWEFRLADQLMSARGHTVHRPSLTGHGERAHLGHRHVDLNLHIQDVVNYLEWEELTDVVLVGHSYGGMVVTGVADRVPGRIRQVIYLDALLPEDGESLYSAIDGPGPTRSDPEGFVTFVEVGRGTPPPHYVPQSAKTFTQPITLRRQAEARRLPSAYILTVEAGRAPEEDAYHRFHQRAAARGWPVYVIEGDHVVHVSRPEAFAALLDRIIRETP